MSKKSENLYKAIGTADPKFISEAENATLIKTQKKLRPIFKAAIAAVLLSLVGIIAIAASPALRNFLNLPFVSQNPKLDSIPDGYVGIYSLADFEKIRYAPSENYILMNDIDLGGSYHLPIGTIESPFNGTFNGNGYKITNFKIEHKNSDEATLYSGFFGYAPYGIIRNLGIENAHVSVFGAVRCHVGMIAGEAGYVTTSYADNCTLTVNCAISENNTQNSVLLGGLCGNVYTIDSCYSNCDINIDGEVSESSTNLYAGKLAGLLYTAVTSWTSTNLNVNCKGFISGIAGLTRCSPKVVPKSVFENIITKMEQHPNADIFYINKLKAFYQPVSKENMYSEFGIENITELFYYEDFDVSTENEFYVYETRAELRELLNTDSILRKSFSDEELIDIFSSSHLKIGEIYCYDLTIPPTDYEGFDFDAVWRDTKGTPSLRIFDK